MWIPALAIVSLLVYEMVTGTAFQPRGPSGRPGGDRAAAAIAGTNRDNDRTPQAAAMISTSPDRPAKDLLAQEGRLGGIITNTKDGEEAAKKVEKIRGQLKVNPKDYRLHYELGNALYDSGDPAGALSAYRKSLSLNPKFIKAYVNLGETLRERGETKAAIDTLQKALTIDNQDDVAHAALGFAYYSEKRYPDAIHEFQTALKINPKSVHATYYMGMAFADAQIYREAIKWWDKVCEIDPNADACAEARENNQLLRRIVQ